MARKLALPDYPRSLPKTIPEGRVLVHNNMRPSRIQGQRGARYWLAEPSDKLVLCSCSWAAELGPHYRPLLQGVE